MQYIGTIGSIISLVISFILAIRLFFGDGKKNTSQQTELVIGMRNIEKSVSNIETNMKNLTDKVDEDHDKMIRMEENQKQVWKVVNEMRGNYNGSKET